MYQIRARKDNRACAAFGLTPDEITRLPRQPIHAETDLPADVIVVCTDDRSLLKQHLSTLSDRKTVVFAIGARTMDNLRTGRVVFLDAEGIQALLGVRMPCSLALFYARSLEEGKQVLVSNRIEPEIG